MTPYPVVQLSPLAYAREAERLAVMAKRIRADAFSGAAKADKAARALERQCLRFQRRAEG